MKRIITLFLVVGVFAALALPSFLIKVRIECKSQFGECPESINTKLASLSKKSIFQAKREVKKILSVDPQVSNYSTQFKLPNTLLVNLLILKPEFAILDKNNSKTYLLDKNGKILGEGNNSALPTIVQSGAKPNIFCLSLIRGVYEMYGVNKGEIVDSSLVIELPSGIRVIFPIEGSDSQVLLGSLRLVYTKVTSADLSGKFSEIDLRFKNPVLR